MKNLPSEQSITIREYTLPCQDHIGRSVSLADALGVCPGVTAVIGGGGKTTLLRLLAVELASRSGSIGRSFPKIILCTSTHVLPFREYPCIETLPYTPTDSTDDVRKTDAVIRRIQESLEGSPVICVGTPEVSAQNDTIKYTAPRLSFSKLSELADYIFVEADGSRHRPFKAHAGHEPVIPPEAVRTIYVAGAFGLMQPVRDVVHRPELFCAQMNAHLDSGAQLTPESLLTPELAAAHIDREKLADICCLFLSRAGTDDMNNCSAVQDYARRFEASLALPLVTVCQSP